MADSPLLDLDTLIVRQTIAIDGVKYEIVNPDEMTVIEAQRAGNRGKRIDEISHGALESEEGELDRLVDEAAHAVLIDVPHEVFAKLSGTQKLAIVDVFTGLLVRSKLGVAGAMAKALDQLPIGAMQSHVSNASTAASRIGGWWRRLLGWFGLI